MASFEGDHYTDSLVSNTQNDSYEQEQEVRAASAGVSTVFGSYYTAIIIMFALSSIGVALSVVPIMLGTDDALLVSVKIAQVTLRGSLGFIIISICSGYIYMHFKSKAGTGMLQTRGHEGNDVTITESSGDWSVVIAPKRSLQTKYMLITLLIFGIGTILSCTLYFIGYSLARARFGIVDDIISDLGIVDNIFQILIICFQLAFFYFYEGEVLNNRIIFHYTIAIMVGAEVWAWVSETLWPLWAFDLERNNTDSVNTNITELPRILEFAKEFLEPFYVEFATIAISVLFHLWNTMNKSNETMELESPVSELYRPRRAISPISNTNISLCKMVISIAVSAALALNLIIICELTNSHEKVFRYLTEIVLYRSIQFVYFSLLLGLSLGLLFKLRGEDYVNNNSLNSSEYVLLVCTCINSVFYILSFVAAFGVLYLDQVSDIGISIAWSFLVFSIIALFQIWVQTKLLITMHRKRIPEYFIYFVVLISAINFGEWFQKSLHLELSKQGESKTVMTPIMEEYFGENNTRIVVILLFPFMVLYRFHSGLMAVELIHEQYCN